MEKENETRLLAFESAIAIITKTAVAPKATDDEVDVILMVKKLTDGLEKVIKGEEEQ